MMWLDTDHLSVFTDERDPPRVTNFFRSLHRTNLATGVVSPGSIRASSALKSDVGF